MTITIIADGTDQWTAVNAALNAGTDRDLIVSGEIFISRGLNTRHDNQTITGTHCVPGQVPTDGFQTLNDTGPCSEERAGYENMTYLPREFSVMGPLNTAYCPEMGQLRDRVHLNIDADNVTVTGIFVNGTKRVPGRSWSGERPTGQSERNWLEAQGGVNATGADHVSIIGCDIFGVWGDLGGANSSGSGTGVVNAKHVLYDGGHWHMAGRHAMGVNGVNGDGTKGSGLHWKNTSCDTFISTALHCENSSNPFSKQSDWWLEDLNFDDSAGDYVHVLSRNGLDRVYVDRIHVDGVIRVDITNDGGDRVTQIFCDGNTWTGVDHSAFDFAGCDTVWVTNSAGQVDPRNNGYHVRAPTSSTTPPAIRCSDVHASNNLNPLVVYV